MEVYETYLELMAQWCARYGVEVWAYCLMPDHVHLIAVPNSENGLGRAIAERGICAAIGGALRPDTPQVKAVTKAWREA